MQEKMEAVAVLLMEKTEERMKKETTLSKKNAQNDFLIRKIIYYPQDLGKLFLIFQQ